MSLKSSYNKNSDELALIIGHLYGDGGINHQGRVYYCNSEDFLIKEFVDSVKKIFNIQPWVHKEHNITRVMCPVSMGRMIWSLFDKFSSGKDTKVITSEIRKMPLKWKKIMLRAWFNDDGSVLKYGIVSIKQKLKPLVEFIQEILSELRIKSRIIEDDRKWLLRICGHNNLVKFRDNINFSKGYRKREKLNKLIDSIKYPHFKTKNKILGLLKESPKTRKKLSKLLKRSEGIIYGHLHGWKRRMNNKRKSTKGLIGLGLVNVKKDGRINVYVLDKTPSPGFGYKEGTDTVAQCG